MDTQEEKLDTREEDKDGIKSENERGSELTNENKITEEQHDVNDGFISTRDENEEPENDDKSEQEDPDYTSNGEDSDSEELEEIREHPSYEQVLLDVNRCAGRLEHIRQCYLHRTDDDVCGLPEDLTQQLELQGESMDHISSKDNSVCNEESEKLKRIAKDLKYQGRLKKRLAKLILKLLMKKPDLHYYQGFHDVCLTYMTNHGYEDAYRKLDSLIDSHFNAFMQPTMIETQEFLNLIPVIIGLQDLETQKFLEEAEVGTIFALSWVITWFSHVIPDERDVELIYSRLEQIDDPHLILYLCAAIVLYKKEQLIGLDPEMSTVHKFLSLVPRKEKLPVADLIDQAQRAFEKWPPNYVKKQFDRQRQVRLHVHNYNILSSLAHRFAPGLAGMIQTSNTRTAIIVFVVASALALQFDRWIR